MTTLLGKPIRIPTPEYVLAYDIRVGVRASMPVSSYVSREIVEPRRLINNATTQWLYGVLAR